jgi:hypothetical protein
VGAWQFNSFDSFVFIRQAADTTTHKQLSNIAALTDLFTRSRILQPDLQAVERDVPWPREKFWPGLPSNSSSANMKCEAAGTPAAASACME